MKHDLDDYADVMLEMKDFCDSNNLNFRGEMAGMARARMRGATTMSELTTSTNGTTGGQVARIIDLLRERERVEGEMAKLRDLAARREAVDVELRGLGVHLAGMGGGGAAAGRVAGKRRPRGPKLVSDAFPGEAFTREQIWAKYGIKAGTGLAGYVRKGHRIGGKAGHVYRWEGDEANRIGESATGRMGEEEGENRTGEAATGRMGEREVKPVDAAPPVAVSPVLPVADSTSLSDDKPGWQCFECDHVTYRSVAPSKCKRCSGRRFNRVASTGN